MKKKYALSLFIFRRDLRCEDNTGLIEALKNSEDVLCCFIFDPRQVGEDNAYRSTNCLEFMIESLQDLAGALEEKGGKLFVLYGVAHDVVDQILKRLPINAVYCNKDYTPFSVYRDGQLKKICKKYECDFYAYHDLLLIEPEKIFNKQDKPYQIFTSFYKAVQKHTIAQPSACRYKNFYNDDVSLAIINLDHELTSKGTICTTNNTNRIVRGGRLYSERILKSIKEYKEYEKTHDMPVLATTHLSAYNKFGTHSIREVWHAIVDGLGISSPLIRQLYWRDFFTYIAYHFPHVFGHAFKSNYDALNWNGSSEEFEKWCRGTTGFPLVDAGMRELNETGFMHNRVRMVVASFLVKDLHIDWRWGQLLPV